MWENVWETHHRLCKNSVFESDLDMQKKITISLDEAVYDGLCSLVGRGEISKFIEDLARPHALGGSLDDGYRAVAADESREREAQVWINDLARDVTEQAQRGLVDRFRAGCGQPPR